MNPLILPEPSIRLEWGPRGARHSVERGDILVVVDVLRFSSAVASAVSAGCWLYPAAPGEEQGLAERYGAECAVRSAAPGVHGGFSLSPESFLVAETGTRVVLSSVNGAVCALHGANVPYLFAAGLVNAAMVSRAVNQLVRRTGIGLTVLACGERWTDESEEGSLRFAVEDYLGAGAILSSIAARMSPEAEVCRTAFEASRNTLRGVIWESESGRELRGKGLMADVDFCSAVDSIDAVPVYHEGCFREYRGLDL